MALAEGPSDEDKLVLSSRGGPTVGDGPLDEEQLVSSLPVVLTLGEGSTDEDKLVLSSRGGLALGEDTNVDGHPSLLSLGALTFGKVPTDKAELVRLSLQRRPMSGKDTEEEQLGSIDNHVVKSIVNGGNIDAAFPIKVRVRVDNRLKVVDCIALLPLHLRTMFGFSQTNMGLNQIVTRKKRMTTRSQVCQKKGKPDLVYIFITTDHNILTSCTYIYY